MTEMNTGFTELLSTPEGVEAFQDVQQTVKDILDAVGPPPATEQIEETK